MQKKGTVLLSTSLAWPAVAGCSRAETFSQLCSISFAQPCTYILRTKGEVVKTSKNCVDVIYGSPHRRDIGVTSFSGFWVPTWFAATKKSEEIDLLGLHSNSRVGKWGTLGTIANNKHWRGNWQLMWRSFDTKTWGGPTHLCIKSALSYMHFRD